MTTHVAKVNDFIEIDHALFLLKRQSSEPWYVLQKVSMSKREVN